MTRTFPMWLTAASVLMGSACAQGGTTFSRSSSSSSSSSSSVSGQITGDAHAQYVIAATPGRQVTVKLISNNASNYFNLLKQGSSEAICQGAMTGNVCVFRAEAGSYVADIYLMRNAARRGEQAQYTLYMEQ